MRLFNHVSRRSSARRISAKRSRREDQVASVCFYNFRLNSLAKNNAAASWYRRFISWQKILERDLRFVAPTGVFLSGRRWTGTSGSLTCCCGLHETTGPWNMAHTPLLSPVHSGLTVSLHPTNGPLVRRLEMSWAARLSGDQQTLTLTSGQFIPQLWLAGPDRWKFCPVNWLPGPIPPVLVSITEEGFVLDTYMIIWPGQLISCIREVSASLTHCFLQLYIKYATTF